MSDSLHSMDYSPPGSSVHGISQARILEWAAISSPYVYIIEFLKKKQQPLGVDGGLGIFVLSSFST